MLDTDPTEDFWQHGWGDGFYSPSQTLPESPFHIDLPPLSPSLIHCLPPSLSNNGLAKSLLSRDVDEDDSNETLGNLIANLPGGPGPGPDLGLFLSPDDDLVLLPLAASESSMDIVTMKPSVLDYWRHDTTLHSSVLLSFEDWVAGGPGGFDDDSLLRHILSGGTAAKPACGGSTTAIAKTKRWEKVVDEGEGSAGVLKSMLIKCAEVVEAGDCRTGASLLAEIQKRASPIGTSRQRLAYYVSESLATRIAGVNLNPNENLWTDANPDAASLPPLLECFNHFNKFTPHMTTARFVTTKVILQATEGASKIHLLELATPDHQPWTDLIAGLATRPSPPLLRITCVVLSDVIIFNTTLKALVERVAEKVAEYARACGVPFEYRLWYGELDALQEETLQRRHDEVFIVNCMYILHILMEETTEHSLSPRDRYLRFIHSLRPKIFIQSEVCASYGASFFLTRFREALCHFESYFEMLDVTCANEEHNYAASGFLGAVLMNAIAFEGTMRVQRPQKYRQWKQRVEAAGFEQVPIDVFIREKATAMMRRRHKDLWVGDEDNWLVLGWKGRLAHATTTWRPRANISLGMPSSHHKKRRVHRTTPRS